MKDKKTGVTKKIEYNTPLVDVCCVVGVESLLRNKCPVDPYAKPLAERFSDFFIWNNSARIIIPTGPKVLNQEGVVGVPSLIEELIKLDRDVVKIEVCLLDQECTIREEKLFSLFRQFVKWAYMRKNIINSLIRLHSEEWIKEYHDKRLSGRYVYNVDNLISSDESFIASKFLNIELIDLCYLFDLSLRYQLYGEYIGSGKYYLSHPIREEQNYSNVKKKKVRSNSIPIRLGKYLVEEYAKPGNLNLFSAKLHEARAIIRDLKLQDYGDSLIEIDIIREVASKLKLSPRIKKYDEIIKYSKMIPIVSTGIKIIDTIWEGKLPRNFANIKWMQWAYEWDMEQESYENKNLLR
ncbi:hypothetical protein QQ008_14045 [Fulvivirgaceae bacterium BMA10]|uniref:Restriction endonuclease n=1 Tax=Splendidivirga corallicola TaxID=3051826 RepID=A0ABT8KP48_9BACT|nr:hypothetical protein [Fulvivirgaceae bacterium BMA10]